MVMTLKKPGVWVVGVLVLMGLLLWIQRPFAQTLVMVRIPTGMLTAVQRNNVSVALSRVQGIILRPGQSFSFNRQVGPRTLERGYGYAPVYVGSDSPPSVGGGICLLSSALYDSALQMGFQIIERHPHQRPIRTLPPGLDATVWYGQQDLRFVNVFPFPVKISGELNPQQLILRWEGRKPGFQQWMIRRQVITQSKHALQVQVTRQKLGSENADMMQSDINPGETVSEDLYRL